MSDCAENANETDATMPAKIKTEETESEVASIEEQTNETTEKNLTENTSEPKESTTEKKSMEESMEVDVSLFNITRKKNSISPIFSLGSKRSNGSKQ